MAFKYDPFGRRIQKSSSGGVTNHLYDGANSVIELDGAANLLARYAQGAVIDEPLAQLRGGTSGYYEQDGLGSVTSLSNSTAALANTYTYDAFGNLTVSTGAPTNPFQYTGRDFDSETLLRYYRARYYDSTTGEFISEDPKRFSAGINFFRYVLNSPINYTDPYGWAACQSGRCDCPGGKWVSGAATGEAGIRIGFVSGGGLLFAGVFLCTSNPTFNVPFVTVCGYGTALRTPPPSLKSPPKKFVGVGAGLGGAAFTCSGIRCREGLSGNEKGWFVQIGPAYYFRETGEAGAGCQGAGVELGLGLGFGGFGCKTFIGESIGGIK